MNSLWSFFLADENPAADPAPLGVGNVLIAFLMLVAVFVLIFVPWVNRWERQQRADRKDRWRDRLRKAESDSSQDPDPK